MLVVLPVYRGDAENALKNLELCSRFGDTAMPFTCLVHTPMGFDASTIVQAATPIFQKVATNTYSESSASGWPASANWAWQEAARAVKSRFNRPWFWWEQDAVPLRPRWLYAIADAYAAGGKPFAGHVV